MEEKFEIVCNECSNTLMSEDSNAEVCPEYWNKMVLDNLKEGGRNIGYLLIIKILTNIINCDIISKEK